MASGNRRGEAEAHSVGLERPLASQLERNDAGGWVCSRVA